MRQPGHLNRPAEQLGGLVRAAQRGDALAMNDLLDLLAPYVGRLCGPIALQEGPDAAQEALIAVFRRLGQLREPAALFGWVRAIAVREAVRVARRGQAGRTVIEATADLPASGDRSLPPMFAACWRAWRPSLARCWSSATSKDSTSRPRPRCSRYHEAR